MDRLIGAQLGVYRVSARVSEGRFGTLYRANDRSTRQEVTLEVLRTELTGDDEEVRASNAIKCPGIANVVDFGQVPDGRRYRVMELLDGESLEQLVQRRGKLPVLEAARLLDQVAEVLEAAHAWAVPHGNLGPSNVLLVGGAVKLIDFGLSKHRATVEGDLQALGALGALLLSGTELVDLVLPPPRRRSTERIDWLVYDLVEKRVPHATVARRQLAAVTTPFDAPVQPPRAPLLLAALALLLAGGGAVAFFLMSPAQEPAAPVTAPEPSRLFDEGPELDLGEADEVEDAQPEGSQTGPRPQGVSAPHRPRVVPSATALLEEASRLESRFRRQVRPGDDVDQALYVLNKQRLRLSGSPTEQDRQDVARQLAGWRRSYLHR